MSHRRGKATETPPLVLRLSVPAQGGLRVVAADFAERVAAYLANGASPEPARAALESLADRVAPDEAEGDITFEFSKVEGALLIRARCSGRSSEARHPLS